MKTFENETGEKMPSNCKMPPDNCHKTMITLFKKTHLKIKEK